MPCLLPSLWLSEIPVVSASTNRLFFTSVVLTAATAFVYTYLVSLSLKLNLHQDSYSSLK